MVILLVEMSCENIINKPLSTHLKILLQVHN